MVLLTLFAVRYTLVNALLFDAVVPAAVTVAAAAAAFPPALRRTLIRLGPSTCVATMGLPKASPWRSVLYACRIVCVL